MNCPTIENNIPKVTNTYEATPESFALVDTKLSEASEAIGESSNLAQLALTYSYNFKHKHIEDSVSILSVLAQIAIDSAKRSFDLNIVDEIKRIKKSLNIDKNGLPYFWFLIKRKSKFAKKQNQEKKKLMEGLNNSLVCPMNYVCDLSFAPKRYSTPALPMETFFVNHPLNSQRRTMKKAEAFIEKYSTELFNNVESDNDEYLSQRVDELISDLNSLRLSREYIGVFSNLINRAFRITDGVKQNIGTLQSNLWRNRPLLLKALYSVNPSCVLRCFSGNIKIV